MDREYPFIQALAGCPQDPVHHAEGDVWIHTRMVCEALVALDAWRQHSEPERQIVFAAAVFASILGSRTIWATCSRSFRKFVRSTDQRFKWV
jgi:hypothetical protein